MHFDRQRHEKKNQNCLACCTACCADGERKCSQTLSNSELILLYKLLFVIFLQNLGYHPCTPQILSFIKAVTLLYLPLVHICSAQIGLLSPAPFNQTPPLFPPSLPPYLYSYPLLPLIHLHYLIGHSPGNRHPRRHSQNTRQQPSIQLLKSLFPGDGRHGLEEPTVFGSSATDIFFLDLKAGLWGEGRRGEGRGRKELKEVGVQSRRKEEMLNKKKH